MTLKQILTRLQTLAESHKQINTFFIGGFDEFMDSPDVTYPAIFCEVDKNHSVGMDVQMTVLHFNLYFFDLMDTAQNSQANEYEVKSDMLEVAKDFYAMLKFTDYQFDWEIGDNCPITISDYQLNDLCAGVSLAVEIGIPYDANRCQVPATDVTFENDTTMKLISVYKHNVIVEATSVMLPLLNKEIMMLFVGYNPLTSVADPSFTPSVNEYRYTANTGLFEFGVDLQVDAVNPQIIQIINRPL
jgi:hypothetical protein